LDFTNKKSDLVLEHAQRFHGDIIVTGIHGKDYMDVEKAKKMGVKVVFQDYKHPVYTQRFGDFVSHLSFIDIMFNHGPHSMEICLENNLTRDAICNSKKQ
jgi:hypothetical protein